MNIKRIGIDLAKQVFQVHGFDNQEKVVIRKQLRRAQLQDYFKKLPPCLIDMEACGGVWMCFVTPCRSYLKMLKMV